jgi:hypothetical protein
MLQAITMEQGHSAMYDMFYRKAPVVAEEKSPTGEFITFDGDLYPMGLLAFVTPTEFPTCNMQTPNWDEESTKKKIAERLAASRLLN